LKSVEKRGNFGCFLPVTWFVGGVMNTLWIAAITILVLAEKVIPAGRAIARIASVGLLAEGVWLLTEALRTA
jgi:predicted metal-binding membrane protein